MHSKKAQTRNIVHHFSKNEKSRMFCTNHIDTRHTHNTWMIMVFTLLWEPFRGCQCHKGWYHLWSLSNFRKWRHFTRNWCLKIVVCSDPDISLLLVFTGKKVLKITLVIPLTFSGEALFTDYCWLFTPTEGIKIAILVHICPESSCISIFGIWKIVLDVVHTSSLKEKTWN